MFYSYLYGIETLEDGEYIPSAGGFTRTFMELKRLRLTAPYASLDVLLVPLWNWNPKIFLFQDFEQRFTRTFMELKQSVGAPFDVRKSMFYSYLYGIETHE